MAYPVTVGDLWYPHFRYDYPGGFAELHLVRHGIDWLHADDSETQYINTYANLAEAKRYAETLLASEVLVGVPVGVGHGTSIVFGVGAFALRAGIAQRKPSAA